MKPRRPKYRYAAYAGTNAFGQLETIHLENCIRLQDAVKIKAICPAGFVIDLNDGRKVA